MIVEYSYCPRCRKRFPGHRVFCSGCGGRTGSRETLTRSSGAQDDPEVDFAKVAIIALLAVCLLGVLALRHFAPQTSGAIAGLLRRPSAAAGGKMITVRSGTLTRCVNCGGRVLSQNVRLLRVPASERLRYGVTEKRVYCDACPGERMEMLTGDRWFCRRCERPLGEDVRTVFVPETEAARYRVAEHFDSLCPVCNKAEALCRAHADWLFDDCRLVVRRRIRVGMNPEQVRVAWGVPQRQLKSRIGRRERVDWRYGDPIFGIPVTDRYAIFLNGRVSTYEGDDWNAPETK